MSKTSAAKLANPFVGLRAFEETEDYLFFGRKNQIDELLKSLGQSRFLAVIGSSGSGKSSLVKSGLLPAVYSGFMTVGSNWRAVSLRPGEDPIGYLTKALSADGILYPELRESEIPYELILEASLRRSENGLVQVYKEAHLPPNEHLLIVIDQFEELFRFNRYEKENNLGRSDAIHFVQILLTAAQQKEYPIYVLLTMRADFLGDCAEFRGLPEAINEGQYLVPRMKRDEIREAITGPVAVSEATISQRLVTRLLNDINNDTDQLPILQHAMMRTWDAWHQRAQHDTPIDFEDYEKIGTMQAALSIHADETYAELAGPGEQQTCELMFKALTDKAADIRGIRRPRSLADLCVLTNSNELQVKKVVEVFRKKGRTFLMPPPAIPLAEQSIIDISHESLMRVWTRLKAWIEEEARSGDIYLRLANSAQLKEQGQRGLLKNPELEIALKWREQNRPTAKWAEGYRANFDQAMVYLDESQKEDLAEKKVLAQKEATRKRLVRAVFGLLSALVIAGIVLAYILNGFWKEAEKQKQQALVLQKKAEAERRNAENERRKAEASDRTTKQALDSLQMITNALAVSEHQKEIAYKEAVANRDLAEKNRRDAVANADEAKQRTKEAQEAFEITRQRNLKIAANEYARLIREGPSDENGNRIKFYNDNYFLAYANHFSRLGNLVAADDRSSYQSLKEKLYFNNDLYRRIYEDFLSIRQKDEVIRREKGGGTTIPQKQIRVDGATVSLQRDGKGLLKTLVMNRGGNTGSSTFISTKKGQELTALAAGRQGNVPLIFCATTDNLIYVFNEQLQKIDSISMGTRVTALHFFSDNNRRIIYFGTASGYIGYVLYNLYKKNQPVFENKLESEITAVEFFTTGRQHANENASFLLAAGKSSSPRVYKLDAGSLKPDKLLLGNELPYTRKEYGTINGAHYSPEAKRIILSTSNGTYSWNPFSDDLLEKLKQTKRFNAATAPENLQLYTE